jgi:hypothetical protein
MCPKTCKLNAHNPYTCEDSYGNHTLEDIAFCDKDYVSDKFYVCKDNTCVEAIKHQQDCTQFGENYTCVYNKNQDSKIKCQVLE